MRNSFKPCTRVALVLLVLAASAARGAEPSLADARRMFLEGKYAEAEDAYRTLPDKSPASLLGIARCQEATGHRAQASETIQSALKNDPQQAALHAELGRLAFDRGAVDEALAAANQALQLDPNQILAVWVQTEVYIATGKLTEANANCQRLVKIYNQGGVKDADDLHCIGLAAAHFARWNRLSDQFSFLVNDFYPDLLAAEPSYWPARLETGRLFAEKYNRAEAGRELKAALKLNPNAAEAQVAAGQQALDEFETAQALAFCQRAMEINPELLAAWHLKADLHLANFEPRQSAGVLADAVKLNPTSEATLGRLAATYLAVDGMSRTGPDSRFGKLLTQVNERNPKPGEFYEALGDALDRLRRWPASADYYQRAIAVMPQAISTPGKLGMILMRLGEEERAKTILDEAFKADPFNVRVKNTLEVLDVLNGYATHETDHFRIKYDPAKDRVLVDYMGQWLEEVYPQLVEQMGFAPPEKSLFEVFSRAKNTDGHGWFSARMVGLPHIHPIGACAGKIVALQSPSEGGQRFNWARVLKHEFVHVINLQQTDFNIPHWFTEALAVMNEGYPPPAEWNVLLAQSAARGKLFDLESINLGFIRPHSSEEWNLAYCQAELYAQYMVERFGKQAIAKMLSAYADNLTTPEALRRSFGVEQADFELGYTEYVRKIVARMPGSSKPREMTLPEIERALAAKPDDPSLLAQLAQAQLDRKNYPDARRHADKALAIEPRQQLANYIRARLHLLVGEDREALARLEDHLDRNDPQESLLSLLAGLKLKSDDFAAAAELYELGARHNTGDAKWLKSLAAVYLKQGDNKKLAEALGRLAEADADDLTVRKKLAQLAHAAGDWPAVEKWTLDGLHFDVRDVELHGWRGDALAAGGSHRAAAREFAVAVELSPDEADLRFKLAEQHLKAGDAAKSRQALEELLKREPTHRGGKELLESLK